MPLAVRSWSDVTGVTRRRGRFPLRLRLRVDFQVTSFDQYLECLRLAHFQKLEALEPPVHLEWLRVHAVVAPAPAVGALTSERATHARAVKLRVVSVDHHRRHPTKLRRPDPMSSAFG